MNLTDIVSFFFFLFFGGKAIHYICETDIVSMHIVSYLV